MLEWLIHLFTDAAVLLLALRFMLKVKLDGYKTALLVALIIGILSFLLSWLLIAVLNIATLGLFYFLGLGFVIRIIAYAVIIELADQLSKDFRTEGFMTSVWLALILAVTGGIVDAILF